MTADIVARLREGAEYNRDWREDCLEAAAEIERLRADRDRLRAALERIAGPTAFNNSTELKALARSALRPAEIGPTRRRTSSE